MKNKAKFPLKNPNNATELISAVLLAIVCPRKAIRNNATPDPAHPKRTQKFNEPILKPESPIACKAEVRKLSRPVTVGTMAMINITKMGA